MENLLKKTEVAAAITFGIYVILFFWVDRAVDLWVHHHWAQTWVPRGGSYISLLGRGDFIKLGIALGFILILAADAGLEKKWSRNLLYLCVAGAVALVIGEGLKYLLGRYRPVMLFEHNLYGFSFFASKWALTSTPSGHTVRAFALLTAASLLCRRGAATALFLSLAALIGLSRIVLTDHYPSDVLFGAFIGIFTALWTYQYFFIKNQDI